MNLNPLITLTASAALFAVAACQGPKSNIAPYPLTDCLVTDNELGSMGDPVTIIYRGQEVKFCCEPCVEEFQAEPGKFLAKIQK